MDKKINVQTPYTASTSLVIISSSDFATFTAVVNVGQATAYTSDKTEIIEWGWYSRVLSDAELLYNVGILNTKYSIF